MQTLAQLWYPSKCGDVDPAAKSDRPKYVMVHCVKGSDEAYLFHRGNLMGPVDIVIGLY